MGEFERGLTIVLVLMGVLFLLGFKANAKSLAPRAESDLP